MRILITGSAGYLGSKVISILQGKGHQLFGIDVKDPLDVKPYTRFIKASVTDEKAMAEIFETSKPDVTIHLAFVVNVLHDRKREEDVAINGTKLFLAHCERQKVAKIILMSSVAAYGAHPDNDNPLTEASQIRGNQAYSYSYFKAETDKIAQDFMRSHKSCAFVILRPCLFIGPNTDNSFFEIFKFPIIPQLSDAGGVKDISFQFIHEDDMASCVVACIEKNVRGVFNVASDGLVKFSEAVKLIGKKRIVVPAPLLYPIASLLWLCRMIGSPPGQMDFMRYPWIMDNAKMKRDLFIPSRTSIEAFNEYAKKKFKIRSS
jgi:UDP-glucose 4-epimerase